jgi:hypothetical protein
MLLPFRGGNGGSTHLKSKEYKMKRHIDIGLGYRKDFAEAFAAGNELRPSFIELAPENWLQLGGYWKKQLDKAAADYPILAHGLSLSIGSPEEVDFNFLREVKKFLSAYAIDIYSEHLSFSKCANAHLYDLLPVPFRMDAALHIAKKIRTVQDFLERQITMEIVSYYTPVAAEMSEVDFIKTIVRESGCALLLDVNNIYVNGFNHGYNPESFLESLPLDSVSYIHMAGHEKVADDLIIDTHGEAIIEPVYDLFAFALEKLPHRVPVLLERDFNIPALHEMQDELDRLRAIYQAAAKGAPYAA